LGYGVVVPVGFWNGIAGLRWQFQIVFGEIQYRADLECLEHCLKLFDLVVDF
jgi:hypothetical protein